MMDNLKPVSTSANIPSYALLRQDIMALADSINNHRAEHLEMIREFNKAITTLVQYADQIALKALDERDANGNLLEAYRYEGPKRPYRGPTTTDIADITAPSRHHCSLCDEPGHRKDTCPNAHKVAKEKKEAPVKKARKPLSEEVKEQLRERLKKARAARRKR
jgi:hypothetical protein